MDDSLAVPSTHSFLAENRNAARSPFSRNLAIAPNILSHGTPLISSAIALTPWSSADAISKPCACRQREEGSTSEVGSEVRGEVGGVVLGAVDEARLAAAQERAAEEVDAGSGDH